ncbi:MAG: hypothetical protein CVV27_01750 [Candidatus Melainabacteria bacterium HGW-Melainabacteria-1]|nr:MAG: hypothetical protein CVV27_01750 [Candidatus Melainabacteria bacterium HGW-Melainabacteria-1]
MTLVLTSLSGCYQLTVQSIADAPLLLNDQRQLAGQRYRVVRHFYRQHQMDYVFGVNQQQDLIVSQLLQAETGPGAGVINLEVRRTYHVLDAVVSALTLGIYARAWIEIEGDIIVWEN